MRTRSPRADTLARAAQLCSSTSRGASERDSPRLTRCNFSASQLPSFCSSEGTRALAPLRRRGTAASAGFSRGSFLRGVCFCSGLFEQSCSRRAWIVDRGVFFAAEVGTGRGCGKRRLCASGGKPCHDGPGWEESASREVTRSK